MICMYCDCEIFVPAFSRPSSHFSASQSLSTSASVIIPTSSIITQMDSRPKSVTPQKRLEGLVIQKRGAIEQPRYLVLDMGKGSISLYKKPPPHLDSLPSLGKRFASSNLANSLKGSLRSGSSKKATNAELQLSCDFLTHLSRESRNYATGEWDPIFTVPFTSDWKIRDVENDEFMFYLVLPSDFKAKDTNVEILSMSMIGNAVSYRNLHAASIDLDSIDEDSATERTRSEPGPRQQRRSITYQQSGFKRSIFKKAFTKDNPLKQEKIL